MHHGILGMISGFAVGVIAAGLVNTTELFGPDMLNSAYFSIILFFTFFGSWGGGLTGVATLMELTLLFERGLSLSSLRTRLRRFEKRKFLL